MCILRNMDSWYDIVNSYDDPKSKDPSRTADGLYSPFSVVIILIYLTFGKDYPSKIANFFQERMNHEMRNHPCASVLIYKNRIASLLKKMEEDELVIMKEEKEKGKRGPPMNKYRLNPKIIQSLLRKGPHIKRDGSIFEIPLDVVERTLLILEESNTDNEVRNRVFSTAIIPKTVDYFTFLMFFETSIITSRVRRKNPDLKREIYATSYIRDYIRELSRLSGIALNRGETMILHDYRPLSDFNSQYLKITPFKSGRKPYFKDQG